MQRGLGVADPGAVGASEPRPVLSVEGRREAEKGEGAGEET